MKTNKSTKAIVVLLVTIVLIMLAGNYWGNGSTANTANPAAVYKSVNQANLFSRIRNWFSPARKTNPSPRDNSFDLFLGCVEQCRAAYNECGESSLSLNECDRIVTDCYNNCPRLLKTEVVEPPSP